MQLVFKELFSVSDGRNTRILKPKLVKGVLYYKTKEANILIIEQIAQN